MSNTLEKPLSRAALERLIRDTVPAPVDPQARQVYESQLADWLNQPEWMRAVAGFGDRWAAYDPSLSL